MTQIDTMNNAEARYLEEIWADCEVALGPGAELRDLRREAADDGVRLVVRYRLGEHDRESAGAGESLLAAHSVLRARIVFDRIRFGFAALVAPR